MMKQPAKIILLLFLLCSAFLPIAASAQKMSVSDLGLTGSQTLQIYRSNGTQYGTWNTTSDSIDLPTEDFILVVKPETRNRWSDPNLALSDGFAFVQTNWISIVVILIVIGAAVRKW